MTLDEVGEEEEEEKITPRTRGRPRKRTRQTQGNPSVPTVSIHLFIKCCSLFNNCPFYAVPLRRSARGKDKTSKDEEEKEAAPVQSATSSEKDESSLSADGQQEPQKTRAKAPSAEPQPGNQTLEGCLYGGRSRTDVKGKKNKS